MLKLFKNIFNKDVAEKNNFEILGDMSNGMGEYASVYFSDISDMEKHLKGEEMLSILISLEDNVVNSENAYLIYLVGMAYIKYVVYYVRGIEKKKYLNNAISFLNYSILVSANNIDKISERQKSKIIDKMVVKNKNGDSYFYMIENYNPSSLGINPEVELFTNIKAKSKLGKLLIEKKEVRDLEKGIRVLEELETDGIMPFPLNSTLARAKRQLKGVTLESICNLCDFIGYAASPAVFREERIKYRTLIRKFKKEKNLTNLKITLNKYYQFSILVTLYYGREDCDSGIFDRNLKNIENIINNNCASIDYTYLNNGKIINSCFISNNDWKTFIKVFGTNFNTFDPRKEIIT